MNIYARYWNSIKQAARARLLKEAGHSTNFSARVYEYLPPYVRTDLTFVIRRLNINMTAELSQSKTDAGAVRP